MYRLRRIKSVIKSMFTHIMMPVRRPIAKALHASGSCYCPVCESNVRRFLPFGNPPRAHARCPVCGSLERHRLDWLFMKEQTNLFDGFVKKMLHVAPEEFFSKRFRIIKNLDCLSADLQNPRAMVRMDITDIHYPDNSFAVIYCSHVLEHIPDDRKAIAELYRVLGQDGWAVLQVPITVERTYEDPSITSPKERKKHFGQSDHVRRCGPDYVQRLESAGFKVRVLRAIDLVTEADCARMGFQPERLVFCCRKASSAQSVR